MQIRQQIITPPHQGWLGPWHQISLQSDPTEPPTLSKSFQIYRAGLEAEAEMQQALEKAEMKIVRYEPFEIGQAIEANFYHDSWSSRWANQIGRKL